MPGEQFVHGIDLGLTTDNALQYIGEIGLRVEPMQLGGVNDRCENGPAFAATC
jgi:hypothetical protein